MTPDAPPPDSEPTVPSAYEAPSACDVDTTHTPVEAAAMLATGMG